MIPINLRISGFLSYLEPVELDFSAFDLACISGSNGAGKSALLDAITWVLFGQARRRDDAIINSRAKAAEVSLDFEYEGNRYRVQRIKPAGKTGVLEFLIKDDDTWRPLTEHTISLTEQRIQQTLRLDYDTFTNASFFLQGKADQFAQQKPSDRKRILSTILGLEIWEEYRERASERRKNREVELKIQEGTANEYQAELELEDERRVTLLNLQGDLKKHRSLREAKESVFQEVKNRASSLDEQAKMVQFLKNEVETRAEKLRGDQMRLLSLCDERDRYQLALTREKEIRKAHREWQEIRVKLEKADLLAQEYQRIDGLRHPYLLAIEGEKARLEQENQHLRLREEEIRTGEMQIPVLQEQASIIKSKVDDLAKRMAKKAEFESASRELQQKNADLNSENIRLKSEMEEIKQQIATLETARTAECPTCNQPLSPDDRDTLLASLQMRGKDLGDRWRQNREMAKTREDELGQVIENLDSLKKAEEEYHLQQRNYDQVNDRLQQMVATITEWQKMGRTRLEEITGLIGSGKFARPNRVELSKLDESLSELGYDPLVHQTLRQAEQEGRTSVDDLRELEKAEAALTPLTRDLETLQAQITQAERSEVEIKQKYLNEAARYAADSAGMPDLLQMETELRTIQEEESEINRKVGAAQQAVDVLKNLKNQRARILEKIEGIRMQITRLKSLEKAFSKDGVPALLIEQALPEIETQANEILDGLTAGAMSVRFATQRDFKDKNREDKKETLDILISDAAGVREYEMFSGGEAFRVNFAIRLALSRVLAQRAGARLQTLVIDEGFGSQDTDGRQRLIEAINMVRENFAKIIVITHLEELKDAFPARIEVEKTPQGSKVHLVT
jgi:DNA repair protein SbcC/Rad50